MFAALRCLDKEKVEVVTSGALLDLVFVLVFVLRISTRCRSCTYLSPKGKEIDFGEEEKTCFEDVKADSGNLDTLVELNQANCVRGLDYNYVSFHGEENIKTPALVLGKWIKDPHWDE